MDLHKSLQASWASLWEELRSVPPESLKHRRQEIVEKMASCEEIAKEIGGHLFHEYTQLSSAIERYLEGKMSLSEIHHVMKGALRIEQDTREL